MNSRHIYFLVGSAVAAFVVLTLADWALRSRTGSLDPATVADSGTAAMQLLPDKSRSRVLAMEYLLRAREAEDPVRKMAWYTKAADGFRAVGNTPRQVEILREALSESPDSANTARIWAALADIKLSARPAQRPAEEVAGLIAAMRAGDIQPGHPLIRTVRKLAASLRKHKFNDLAGSLEAAVPKPRPKEPEII